jgi:cytosine/adenosine deaminase-related metal-dependent hydrolase
MSDNRRLIRDACVITMDPAIGTLERGDILIEGERIREVAPDIEANGCEMIDGTAMIAIPGFVDTHRHVFTAVLRGLGADYTTFDYAANVMVGIDPHIRAEDVYIGTYAGGLEALESGVTTVVDHADCINSPEHADEIIRAHEDSGIRTIFCYGMSGREGIEPGELPDLMALITPPEWHFDDARRVRETLLSADDGRIRFAIAMTELEGFPIDLSRREIEFGRELGAHLIGCNAGLGPLSNAGTYVVELADAGLLGPDILIIHGPTLTDDELDCIAAAKASIAAAPENELQAGLGYPVVGRAMMRGVQASIGIDSVMGYRGDLFTQMRFALQAERLRRCEELARQGLAPRRNTITAKDMLELATIGGARAINLDAELGSLTPGKQADVVLVRTDRLGLAPVIDPVNTVVSQANAADVDSVFLAGEPVKRGGRLLNVDLPSIIDRLAASRDHILTEWRKHDTTAVIEMMESILPLG